MNNKYYLATIDGNKCKTIDDFLIEIGKAFDFPDHYGENMNALNDCISDLDWIKEDNYKLMINNSENFISDNDKDRQEMIDFLKEISEEWANVPNFEGEDEWRKKSEFIVIYE